LKAVLSAKALPGDVLTACEADGLGFLPWAPIAMGELLGSSSALAGAAARHEATQAQIALAWLLHRSPVVLPIPGTGFTRPPARERQRRADRAVRERSCGAGARPPAPELTGAQRHESRIPS